MTGVQTCALPISKTGKGNSVGGFFGGIFDKIKHLDGGNDNVEYDT